MPAGCGQREPDILATQSRNDCSCGSNKPWPFALAIKHNENGCPVNEPLKRRFKFDLLPVPGRKPEFLLHTKKSAVHPMIRI